MKIELQLLRKYFAADYTIGKLYVQDRYLCDVIEDPVRDKKIPHITAIPYGKYRVTVTMSPKFGRLLPLLLDVPEFEGIRIHRGNSAIDSSGCLLPGENKVKGQVINSTQYEEMLTGFIRLHEKLGDEVYINIIR
jgi:hypothetical protein